MKEVSRRRFLHDAAGIAVSVSLLAACDSAPPQAPEEKSASPEDPKPTEVPAQPATTCDLSQLTDAEKAPREALKYVDSSPDPAKSCANCKLFIADNGGCAGCTLFKGPVEPKGYCASWQAA